MHTKYTVTYSQCSDPTSRKYTKKYEAVNVDHCLEQLRYDITLEFHPFQLEIISVTNDEFIIPQTTTPESIKLEAEN